MNTRAALSIVALAVLCLAHLPAANAQFATTITDNGATFTPGANDISQLSHVNYSRGGADYSDNYTPGQTFTTGANPLGYMLNSLTLKGSGSSGNYQDDSTFTVRIESVGPQNSGGYTTLTPIASFKASAASLQNHDSDFFTFNLSGGNVKLASGTTYAFDFQTPNPGGTFYFGTEGSDYGNPYSGGIAFNEEYYNGSSIRYIQSYDRTFNLGLTPTTAAPEPSQLAGLGFAAFGALGLVWKARKRKTRELTA